MCGCKSKQTSTFLGTPNPDCPYTSTILEDYKTRLICIKEAGYENEALINMYLGTLISAIYYPSDFCHYKDTLDQLTAFLQTPTLPC